MASEHVHSFIDLLAFAGPAPLAADFIGGRTWLDTDDDIVAIASLRLGAGTGAGDALPGDEFILLLSGDLTLTAGTGAVSLAGGDSAVLPRGLDYTWRSAAGAHLIILRSSEVGAAGADRPVAIDRQAALEPSGAPLADLLIGPTPSCRNHTDYRSGSTEFVCGTWDSTPYHRRTMPYRHVELMQLLAGSVHFVDGAGREATFRQGDVFVVERGAECSWESREHVAKVYAIHRPA